MAKNPADMISVMVIPTQLTAEEVSWKEQGASVIEEAEGLLHLSDAACKVNMHSDSVNQSLSIDQNVNKIYSFEQHYCNNHSSSSGVDLDRVEECSKRFLQTMMVADQPSVTTSVSSGYLNPNSTVLFSHCSIAQKPVLDSNELENELAAMHIFSLKEDVESCQVAERKVEAVANSCEKIVVENLTVSDCKEPEEVLEGGDDDAVIGRPGIALTSPRTCLATASGSPHSSPRIGELFQVTELPVAASLSTDEEKRTCFQRRNCRSDCEYLEGLEVVQGWQMFLPVFSIPRPKAELWKPLEEGRELVVAMDLDRNQDEAEQRTSMEILDHLTSDFQVDGKCKMVGIAESSVTGSAVDERRSPGGDDASTGTSRPVSGGGVMGSEDDTRARMQGEIDRLTTPEAEKKSEGGKVAFYATELEELKDSVCSKVDPESQKETLLAVEMVLEEERKGQLLCPGKEDANKVRGRSKDKGKLRRAMGKGSKGAALVMKSFPLSSDLQKWRLSGVRAIAPGKQEVTWSKEEIAAFLLALYLFGKQFKPVQKFVQTKTVGDLIHFYYGEFYATTARARWLAGKSNRPSARKYVRGSTLVCGWRQKELLRRLASNMPSWELPRLTQTATAYNNGEVNFEAFVMSLRDLVGLRDLTAGVGIGSGKGDLTSASGDPGRGNNPSVSPVEIPLGVACRALSVAEVVAVLVGGQRLSKTRAQDLFWEAVWPRLEAKGWSKEGPLCGRMEKEGKQENWERWERASQRGSGGLFFAPGVRELRGAEKGSDFFDSLSMVLAHVAKNPNCLEGAELADKRERELEDEVTKQGGRGAAVGEEEGLSGKKRTGNGTRERAEVKRLRAVSKPTGKENLEGEGYATALAEVDMEVLEGCVFAAAKAGKRDLARNKRERDIVQEKVHQGAMELRHLKKRHAISDRLRKAINRQPTFRDWHDGSEKSIFSARQLDQEAKELCQIAVIGQDLASHIESGSDTCQQGIERTAVAENVKSIDCIAEDSCKTRGNVGDKGQPIGVSISGNESSCMKDASDSHLAVHERSYCEGETEMPVEEQVFIDANNVRETATESKADREFKGDELQQSSGRKRRRSVHVPAKLEGVGLGACDRKNDEDKRHEGSGMEGGTRLSDPEDGTGGMVRVSKKRTVRRRSPCARDELACGANVLQDAAVGSGQHHDPKLVEEKISRLSVTIDMPRIDDALALVKMKDFSGNARVDRDVLLPWQYLRSRRSRSRSRAPLSRTAGALCFNRLAKSHSLAHDLCKTGDVTGLELKWKEEDDVEKRNQSQKLASAFQRQGSRASRKGHPVGDEALKSTKLHETTKPVCYESRLVLQGNTLQFRGQDVQSGIGNQLGTMVLSGGHKTHQNPASGDEGLERHFGKCQQISIDRSAMGSAIKTGILVGNTDTRALEEGYDCQNEASSKLTTGGDSQVEGEAVRVPSSGSCLLEEGENMGQPSEGGTKRRQRSRQSRSGTPVEHIAEHEKTDGISFCSVAPKVELPKVAVEAVGGRGRKGIRSEEMSGDLSVPVAGGGLVEDGQLGRKRTRKSMEVVGMASADPSHSERSGKLSQSQLEVSGTLPGQTTLVQEATVCSSASKGKDYEVSLLEDDMEQKQIPWTVTVSPAASCDVFKPKIEYARRTLKDELARTLESGKAEGVTEKSGILVPLLKRPERPAEAFEALILVSMGVGEAASIADFVCKKKEWVELGIAEGLLEKKDVDIWNQKNTFATVGGHNEGEEVKGEREQSSPEEHMGAAEKEEHVLKWGGKGDGKGRIVKRFRGNKKGRGHRRVTVQASLHSNPSDVKDDSQASKICEANKESSQPHGADSMPTIEKGDGQTSLQKLARAVKQVSALKAGNTGADGGKSSSKKVGGRPFTKWLNGKLVKVSARGFTWGGRRVKGSGLMSRKEVVGTDNTVSAEMPKKIEGLEDDISDVVGRKKRGRPKGSLSRKGRKGDDCGTVLGTKDGDEGGNLGNKTFRKSREHFPVPVRNDVSNEVQPMTLKEAKRRKVEEAIGEATDKVTRETMGGVTMDGPTGEATGEAIIEPKEEVAGEAMDQINTIVDLLEVANTVVSQPRRPARCPEKTEHFQHTDRRRPLMSMAGRPLDHGLNRCLNIEQQQSFRSGSPRSHNLLVELETGSGSDPSNRRKRTRINREGVILPTRTKCWAKSLSLATENAANERGFSRNPERNSTM